MTTPSLDQLQHQAQRLQKALAHAAARPRDGHYPLAVCQELAARLLGAAHWHEALENTQRPPSRPLARPSPSRKGRPVSARPARTIWSRWPTEHLLGHTLVLGAAGSGRTTALKTLALAAREARRGVVMVNASPDLSVHPGLLAHAADGRLPPVQHLNFLRAGNGDLHTFNPAAWLTAPDLIAWLEALGRPRLSPPPGWSFEAWRERGLGIWTALAPILVWQRDHRGRSLDWEGLLRATTWDGLNELWSLPDLPADERQGLRRYLTPWFTLDDAAARFAPVGEAWEQALGRLRGIGPYLDQTIASLGGIERGGNLYRLIDRRETLLVSCPAQWRGPDDPMALAYESFMHVLLRVLTHHATGARPADPSAPTPWRTTLLLDNASGPALGVEGLAQARAQGVAVVMSHQDQRAARAAGCDADAMDACATVLQMKTEDPDDVQKLLRARCPDLLDDHGARGLMLDLMGQRPGEALWLEPEGHAWVTLENPSAPVPERARRQA